MVTLAFSNLTQAKIVHPTCKMHTRAMMSFSNDGSIYELRFAGLPQFERSLEDKGYYVHAMPTKFEENDLISQFNFYCGAERVRGTRQIQYLCAANVTVWLKDATQPNGFKTLGFGSTGAYAGQTHTDAIIMAEDAAMIYVPKCSDK